MDVEVTIYISKIKKYFEDNPNDLKNMISLSKKEMFFDELEKASIDNYNKHGYPELYEEQIYDICNKINYEDDSVTKIPIFKTKYGEIILN